MPAGVAPEALRHLQRRTALLARVDRALDPGHDFLAPSSVLTRGASCGDRCRRLAVLALALGRLLLEDVARVGVTAADLALGGQLEALLGARVGLHLRHRGVRVKQTCWGRVGGFESRPLGVLHEQRDLDAVVEVELGQDRRDVALDGRDAQVQLGRDRGVGLALGDGERDLAVAVGQLAAAARGPPRCRAPSPSSSDASRSISLRVTVGDSMLSPAATSSIARTMSAGGVSLTRKPGGAVAQRLQQVVVGVERRQHERPRAGSAAA